jgi:hypothetical protein
MERKVIDCDKCKKEIEQPIRIAIPNGVTHEFVGHTGETYFDYEEKDLCPVCAEAMLKFLFSYGRKQPGQTIEQFGRYQHPTPAGNDAIRLALKFFGIKEKT